MKTKMLIIFLTNFLFLGTWLKPVFALEHTQKDGVFSMDIPAEWHWAESPEEILITYPDGKTIALDIQMIPSRKLSQTDMKKAIKESNDKMIKEGIEAHHGTLVGNKEIKLDGVYATRIDFNTVPPNSIAVTYVSFFNKGYAFTITYGSEDEKMHALLDDALATIRF